MTQREFLTAIAGNTTLPKEIVDYANTAIHKLDERLNVRRTTPTPKQKETAELATQILSTLDRGATYYAKDLKEQFNLSPQKAASLLRMFVMNGTMEMAFDSKGNRAYTFKNN